MLWEASLGTIFLNGKIPGKIPTEVFVEITTTVTKQSGKIMWRDFFVEI